VSFLLNGRPGGDSGDTQGGMLTPIESDPLARTVSFGPAIFKTSSLTLAAALDSSCRSLPSVSGTVGECFR
jgi:hypothetical protein